MPKIKVSPFTLIITVLICCSMKAEMLFTVIISVISHEGGHILASFLCKSGIECISFTPLGITIYRKAGLSSYKKDIFIYAFGPLMSALLMLVGITLKSEYLTVCNAALLALNLLPIKVFDGGKILFALLGILVPHRAEFIVKAVSAVLIFLMWICAVYILIMTSSNIFLFMMCVYLFFAIFL